MKTKKIYLSGAMGSLTLQEQLSWRFDFINDIKTCDYTYSPIYFNPPNFWKGIVFFPEYSWINNSS